MKSMDIPLRKSRIPDAHRSVASSTSTTRRWMRIGHKRSRALFVRKIKSPPPKLEILLSYLFCPRTPPYFLPDYHRITPYLIYIWPLIDSLNLLNWLLLLAPEFHFLPLFIRLCVFFRCQMSHFSNPSSPPCSSLYVNSWSYSSFCCILIEEHWCGIVLWTSSCSRFPSIRN